MRRRNPTTTRQDKEDPPRNVQFPEMMEWKIKCRRFLFLCLLWLLLKKQQLKRKRLNSGKSGLLPVLGFKESSIRKAADMLIWHHIFPQPIAFHESWILNSPFPLSKILKLFHLLSFLILETACVSSIIFNTLNFIRFPAKTGFHRKWFPVGFQMGWAYNFFL